MNESACYRIQSSSVADQISPLLMELGLPVNIYVSEKKKTPDFNETLTREQITMLHNEKVPAWWQFCGQFLLWLCERFDYEFKKAA